MKTLGKYYIVDIGLRNYLLGYRDGDTGHILENTIYFELIYRGYASGVLGQQMLLTFYWKMLEKLLMKKVYMLECAPKMKKY